MSAAELLAGSPAPAPAPGVPAPPAPAPEPSPAPAPEPSLAPGPAPVPGPAPAPAAAPAWFDGLDEESKSFIAAKGFKSQADALAALRAVQPPDTPDAYELPVPDGEDPAFAKSMAPVLHKAGVSPAQAKALAEGWNALASQQRQAAADAQAASEREASALADRQDQDLKREWGTAYTEKAEHGKRAVAAGAAAAGVDSKVLLDGLQALEAKIGYGAMMKFFAFHGQHIAEDKAHGITQPGGGATLSPEHILFPTMRK
jgi:hypothetical protein